MHMRISVPISDRYATDPPGVCFDPTPPVSPHPAVPAAAPPTPGPVPRVSLSGGGAQPADPPGYDHATTLGQRARAWPAGGARCPPRRPAASLCAPPVRS